jgi:hypothetical protein
MNGITVEMVASSWIDALGGLSQRYWELDGDENPENQWLR